MAQLAAFDTAIVWPLAAGVLLAFAASLSLTQWVRRYAVRRQLMDVPNARSSHRLPTPRGGGLGFVIVVLAALPGLAWLDAIDWRTATALGGAGGLAAAVGFADDHRHVAARWRLLAHALAAAWGLFWLGGLPPLAWGAATVDLGWSGDALAWLGLIWLLNLYNFMDGIDGLAAAEACCVLAAGALFAALVQPSTALLPLLGVALGAVGGFLWWNRPPARIFMGDVGSGFLGLLLGLLAIAASHEAPQILWGWAIMLACFVTDASWTLGRRIARGEKIYEAHRSHAYQCLARRWGSHGQVVVGALALNLALLLPLATAAVLAARVVPAAIMVGYGAVLLIVLAAQHKAGEA